MRKIHTRAELQAFAAEQGVRRDWHEPDEQDLGARVAGVSFDNAGGWPSEHPAEDESPYLEMHVIFQRTEVRDGVAVPVEDLACVNLATLCAWASETGVAEPVTPPASRLPGWPDPDARPVY